VTLTLTGTIDPNATGLLTNIVTVAAPTGVTDTNSGNNTAADTDTTPQADLAVTVTDGKTTVVPGASNTYTITVANNGPDTVTSLTLTDTIPAALLNPNFTPSAGAYDTNTGIWSGLNLASGQSVTLTLTGTIDPNATGQISNIVTVSPPAGTTDPTPGNNSAQDIDTIPVATTLATTASPNVTLSNSSVALSDSATLTGGSNPTGNIVFTLTGPGGFSYSQTDPVTGDGTYAAATTLPTTGTVAGTYSWTAQYTPGDANNLGSTAPAQPTVVSAASPGLTTTASPGGPVGSTLTDSALLSGGYFPTGTITFELFANGVAAGTPAFTDTIPVISGDGTYTSASFTTTVAGTYSWQAVYSGDGNNNTVPSTVETVSVEPQADLAVTVTDGKTTAAPGSSDTYTITVTNNGPSTAVGASVTDLFSAADFTAVTWLAVTTGGSSVTAASGTGNINDTVTLLPNGTVTYIVTGQISASATGSLTNNVTVTPPVGTTDPNPTNNTATDADALALPTDLSVTITDAATTLVPGSVDTYTITVSNNGPSTVSSFTLIDTIPAALLNPTFGSPSAGSYDRGSGLWSGLSLANGQSVSIALSGVIGIATGTLSNTVTVAAPAG
jgi:uncharacterized repeat protein (TIGR01451 family)